MSVCPFNFKDTIEQAISTLSFNYSFDITTSITAVDTSNVLNEGLSIKQSPKAPAIILSLGGRTSKAVMSIGMNGKLSSFNLYNAYITKVFPKFKKLDNAYSFVIEGISANSVNGEKIMIFIPINPPSLTNKLEGQGNQFFSIHSALTSINKLKEASYDLNVDFNKIIPEENFYYYTYTDSSGTSYNIIAFDTSNLSYDTTFEKILDGSLNIKSSEYFSSIKEKNNATISYPLFISTSNPSNQDIITTSLEDNIYIDCQPVDLINKEGGNYMQTTMKEAMGLITYLEVSFPYLIMIVFIILLVIFIFSISSFLKKNLAGDIDSGKIDLIGSMIDSMKKISVFGKSSATTVAGGVIYGAKATASGVSSSAGAVKRGAVSMVYKKPSEAPAPKKNQVAPAPEPPKPPKIELAKLPAKAPAASGTALKL
jgi:hypothetical protein